jgi:hypothetical protein
MFDINSFLSNPQLMGGLGLAQGLIQASGPSNHPVSLGSALGMGAGSALQNMLAARRYGNQLQQHAMNQYMNAGAPNALTQAPTVGMTVPTPSGLLAAPVNPPYTGLLSLMRR